METTQTKLSRERFSYTPRLPRDNDDFGEIHAQLGEIIHDD